MIIQLLIQLKREEGPGQANIRGPENGDYMAPKGDYVYRFSFPVEGQDFLIAGEASSQIKDRLKKLGIKPEVIRRASIVTYEAEINIVIHAYRGEMRIEVDAEMLKIIAMDEGPGIPDINQAMQEGYSTVGANILEMGFGAGMGLPNIKRFADDLSIESEKDVGTTLTAIIYL